MKIAMIASAKDSAGMNIKIKLERRFSCTGLLFESYPILHCKTGGTEAFLLTTDRDSIHCECIDDDIAKVICRRPDLLIFMTRHQSASGIRSLSVHSPGNWGKAEYGGADGELCIAPSSFLRFCLFRLEREKEERKLDYEVIQECTHHGPFLKTPVMFIEIGSEEKSWTDPEAGEAIASTLINLLDNMADVPKYRPALGIGGLHHAPSFTNVMHRTDLAFGHVCPKYMLAELTKEKIVHAMEKTSPHAEIVVLDWKGLGEMKAKVKQMLDELEVNYEKSHSLQE